MNCYKGIYGSDNIQGTNTFPYAIVVNTQKISQPGEHWVALYITGPDQLEYFDSFGEGPNSDIQKFTKTFKNIKINSKKLQSDFDNSCGSHVIYFIISRCSGKSFNRIIEALKHPYSDTMVKLFVYKLLA
jgi:hypothetical protein